MKVRSSTRATSAGFDRTRMLLGRFAGLTGMAVPASVINCIIPWYSACEPLHQCTPSGLHIRATSSTQRTSCRLTVDSASIVCVRLAMSTSPCDRPLSSSKKSIPRSVRWDCLRFDFQPQLFDMVKSLRDSQRIHLACHTLPRLKRRFKIVPGNFDGEGIGNHLAGTLLIFHPRRMRQGHPYWTPVNQELDIHSICVSRGNGHDESLVNAMHTFLRPAIDGVEVLIHGNRKLYQEQAHAS